MAINTDDCIYILTSSQLLGSSLKPSLFLIETSTVTKADRFFLMQIMEYTSNLHELALVLLAKHRDGRLKLNGYCYKQMRPDLVDQVELLNEWDFDRPAYYASNILQRNIPTNFCFHPMLRISGVPNDHIMYRILFFTTGLYYQKVNRSTPTLHSLIRYIKFLGYCPTSTSLALQNLHGSNLPIMTAENFTRKTRISDFLPHDLPEFLESLELQPFLKLDERYRSAIRMREVNYERSLRFFVANFVPASSKAIKTRVSF